MIALAIVIVLAAIGIAGSSILVGLTADALVPTDGHFFTVVYGFGGGVSSAIVLLVHATLNGPASTLPPLILGSFGVSAPCLIAVASSLAALEPDAEHPLGHASVAALIAIGVGSVGVLVGTGVVTTTTVLNYLAVGVVFAGFCSLVLLLLTAGSLLLSA